MKPFNPHKFIPDWADDPKKCYNCGEAEWYRQHISSDNIYGLPPINHYFIFIDEYPRKILQFKDLKAADRMFLQLIESGLTPLLKDASR